MSNMAVIIDEIIADPAPAAVQTVAPRDPAPVVSNGAIRMDQLRTELQRDAHRRARIWAD